MAAAAAIQLHDLVALRAVVEDEIATQQDTKDKLFCRTLREYFTNKLSARTDRTEEMRLQWLLFVFRFFKKEELHSIRACVGAIKSEEPQLYDTFSTPANTDEQRTRDIRFSVMQAVGLWLGMPSYFDDTRQSFMPIVLGYRPGPALAMDASLCDLISKNRLVPSRSEARIAFEATQINHPMADEHIEELLDSLEAPGFGREDLNANTIAYFTNATIGWTENVCEHLSTTEKTGQKVLRVFCRPSILLSSHPYQIDDQLRTEVILSYHILFHAYDEKSEAHREGFLNSLFRRAKWCGCSPCSLERLKAKLVKSLPRHTGAPVDPAMKRMIKKPSESRDPRWDPETFEYLWPKILKLHDFQRDSRPWNFWVLFKDRRDTVKFWTFLFAAIIIPLTVLQLLISIVQAVAAFPPVSDWNGNKGS